MRHLPRPSRLLLPYLLLALASAAAGQPRVDPDQVWIIVNTLVVDALGTRTVDTSTARVRFGQRGLLIRRVPYGGPPLSFRVLVRADRPEGEEVPLSITSEVWRGAPDPRPPESSMTLREDTTRIVPGTSYLLELEHESGDAVHGERRILLSFAVSREDPGPLPGVRTTRPVNFLLEVIRTEGDAVSYPDTHALSSLEGRPVTYSSGVRSADGRTRIGLDVTLIAEQVAGDLITVSIRLEGTEAPGADGAPSATISHESQHTVRSGRVILVETEAVAPVQEGGAGPGPRITYTVTVTPSLG